MLLRKVKKQTHPREMITDLVIAIVIEEVGEVALVTVVDEETVIEGDIVMMTMTETEVAVGEVDDARKKMMMTMTMMTEDEIATAVVEAEVGDIAHVAEASLRESRKV